MKPSTSSNPHYTKLEDLETYYGGEKYKFKPQFNFTPYNNAREEEEDGDEEQVLINQYNEEEEDEAEDILPNNLPYTNFPLKRLKSKTNAGKRSEENKRKRRLENVTRPFDFNWNKAGDLDTFLERVYNYYKEKGIYCISLSKVLNLISVAFVVIITVIMTNCIDYAKVKPKSSLSEAWNHKCHESFSPLLIFTLTCIGLIWAIQCLMLIYEIRDNLEIYHFYTKVLGIPEEDISTIHWDKIVGKMARLPPPIVSNSDGILQPQKLDVYNVANRILKRENYLIALFNQDLLDFSLPFSNKTLFTSTLEWNIKFIIYSTFFDSRGSLFKGVLKPEERLNWAKSLRLKFQFMGLINLIFGPIIVIYFTIFAFMRYFDEYYRNPKLIGIRQYTLLAKWKFREFNELPHYFDNRINSSYPLARDYISHFPNHITTIIVKFVSFILGSIASILGIVALVHPELALEFDLTPERSIIYFVGIFATILAVCRGMIPEEEHTVDPENCLFELVEKLHYMPRAWIEKLHSDRVRREFSVLFSYKVVHLIEEIYGILFTPIILWLRLPDSSEKLVDFLKENTSHVEGMGYHCSLALFDVRRHAAPLDPSSPHPTSYHLSKKGKMEKSLLYFKQMYPEWIPQDPAGSLYIHQVFDLTKSQMNTMYQSTTSEHMGEEHAGYRSDDQLNISQQLSSYQEKAGVGLGVMGLMNLMFENQLQR